MNSKWLVSRALPLLVILWSIRAYAATDAEVQMASNDLSLCALTKLQALMDKTLNVQPVATYQVVGYSTEGGILSLHRRKGDALSAVVELFGESGRVKTRAVRVGRDMMFQMTWTDYREPLPSQPVRIASTTVLRGFLCDKWLVVDAVKGDRAAARIDEFRGLVEMLLTEVGKHDPTWVGGR